MVYVRRMDFGQTEAGGKSEYIFVTNLKLLVRVGRLDSLRLGLVKEG
jgi:hypothetical protein